MGNSIANVQYGTYVFDPVPQIGLRESMKRLGDSGNGPAKKECVITVVGVLEGENHNAIEAKVALLRAAMAKEGQTFLWNDGSTNRVNATVQPLGCDIPEDWAQYEVKYTLTFLWFPNDETYWAHELTATLTPSAAPSVPYTFSPLPVLGTERAVNRESAEADRMGDKVTVTLQGFIDKGSFAANLAEFALLEVACDSDGTLVYGGFTQTVRIQRLTRPPDIGDAKMSYTLALEYDDPAATGIVRMASSRSILSEERDAIDYAPFLDDGAVQRVGRNGQRITATGYVVGTSLAAAKAAALTEINLQFPGVLNTDCVEPTREIREIADEKKVEWNVQRYYPIPWYSADDAGNELYGASAVFA